MQSAVFLANCERLLLGPRPRLVFNYHGDLWLHVYEDWCINRKESVKWMSHIFMPIYTWHEHETCVWTSNQDYINIHVIAFLYCRCTMDTS